MDIFSLKDKTALVTGATRGIGQAIAIGLSEAGADIVLTQRQDEMTSTEATIHSMGGKCDRVIVDLGKREEVKGLIEKVTSSRQIDILVNVAGVMRRHAAEDFPDEVFDEVMEVNFNGTFLLCRDIGKYWISKGIKGRLINTASLATFQGGVRMAAYAASKGAIGQLTKALSNEWAAHGIRVNALAPGYIATDMNIDTRTNSDQTYYNSITARIPAGHWGDPKDFKGPAIFLASEASSYITGEIIVVDGGFLAR